MEERIVQLFATDYVLYDEANEHVLRFEGSNDMIIYDNKSEADDDCYGNEYVVKCTDLPTHFQAELVNQIIKNNK